MYRVQRVMGPPRGGPLKTNRGMTVKAADGFDKHYVEYIAEQPVLAKRSSLTQRRNKSRSEARNVLPVYNHPLTGAPT